MLGLIVGLFENKNVENIFKKDKFKIEKEEIEVSKFCRYVTIFMKDGTVYDFIVDVRNNYKITSINLQTGKEVGSISLDDKDSSFVINHTELLDEPINSYYNGFIDYDDSFSLSGKQIVFQVGKTRIQVHSEDVDRITSEIAPCGFIKTTKLIKVVPIND